MPAWSSKSQYGLCYHGMSIRVGVRELAQNLGRKIGRKFDSKGQALHPEVPQFAMVIPHQKMVQVSFT